MTPRAVALLAAVLMAIAIGTPAAQERRRPPRDAAPPPASIDPPGAIAGRVVTAESGAPIRRATVVAMNAERMDPYTVFTDDNGIFELNDLEPGPWQVTVSKIGFSTQQFGRRRLIDSEQPVVVAPGARATADFALLRAGAISGRIYDEQGDPLSGVRVYALRSRIVQHRRYLQRIGDGDQTDDRGAYRLYGLPPGEYYVAASLRVAPADSVVQSTHAPTYYPGTASFAEAQRVLIAAGSETSLDFPALPFRAARVTGVVLSSSGAPADAFLNLTSESGELGIPLGIGGATRADGRFTLPDVPPGTYTLTASLKGTGIVGSEVASVPLVVYGEDVSGVTLVLARPGSLAGVVVADAGVSRRVPPGTSIHAQSIRSSGDAAFADADASGFRMSAPDGPFRLHVTPPEGWMVTAVLLHDADATDAVVDIRGERDAPVRIVLTDRATTVSGTAAGGSVRARAVVLFPVDSGKWEPPSRYVFAVPVEPNGTFRVSGVPAKTPYLAVAVDALEDGEGEDPEFLARMRDYAAGFTLAEGGVAQLELPVRER